jgi:hypothetical protein
MSTWVAVSLLSVVLNTPPQLQVQGTPLRAEIAGEGDSFVQIAPGQEIRVSVLGPGRVVCDVRRFRDPAEKAPERSVIDIVVDGKIFYSKPVVGQLNRLVVTPGGRASSANLVEVPIDSDKHLIEVKVARGTAPALVSFTTLEPAPEVAMVPLSLVPRKDHGSSSSTGVDPDHPSDEDDPAANGSAKTRTLVAQRGDLSPDGQVDRSSSSSSSTSTSDKLERGQVAIDVTMGLAIHLQLGGFGPMLGLAAEAQVGPDRAFGVGISVDYLRYPLLVTVPDPTGGSTTVSGSLQSLPLLVRASWRPLDGWFQPFLGVGAGVTIGFLNIDTLGSSNQALLTGEVHLGASWAVGPGSVMIQGRLVVAGGDFGSVAQRFQVGGASAEAGYRLEL